MAWPCESTTIDVQLNYTFIGNKGTHDIRFIIGGGVDHFEYFQHPIN